MASIQETLDKAIIETPMGEFKTYILQVCGWLEEEGVPAGKIRDAAKSAPEDLVPLRSALDAYYVQGGGGMRRVKPEYEGVAGHLSCLCSTVKDIEKKKRFIAEGVCNG